MRFYIIFNLWPRIEVEKLGMCKIYKRNFYIFKIILVQYHYYISSKVPLDVRIRKWTESFMKFDLTRKVCTDFLFKTNCQMDKWKKMEYCWKLCVNCVRRRLKKEFANIKAIGIRNHKGYIDIGFESRINAKNVVWLKDWNLDNFNFTQF